MDEQTALEREAAQALANVLVPEGYRLEPFERDRWGTTLRFVGREPGVELTLDWHEFRAHAQLVRLDGERADEPRPAHSARRRDLRKLLFALGAIPPPRRPSVRRSREQVSTIRADVAEAVSLLQTHRELLATRWEEGFDLTASRL